MRHNLPSVRTLSLVFGENAKQARAVLQMSFAELCDTIHGAARIAECHNTPTVSDVRMHVLDALAGTHGVESFQLLDGSWCDYLNTGDTYAATLVRFRGRYRVTSWGDIAERHA